MSSVKFDLAILGWQQFELLAFKCLQEDISRSIKYFDGGKDKGRDIIYSGVTHFFEVGENSADHIFQVKHKSDLKAFADLKNDLNKELRKVIIRHDLPFDNYCLVTNLPINANEYDELRELFIDFKAEHSPNRSINFYIYDYHHFESAIEKYSYIKWSFPSIVKSTDFEYIIRNLFIEKNSLFVKTWLSIFNRNRAKFINTNIYEEAKVKIEDNTAILLSGPPRTGKTFTAEMILLDKFIQEGFCPYKIDNIEKFFNFFVEGEKQLFLFDDTFGRHEIEPSRADEINRKLEDVFELLDSNHKCVFTSREYIVRAFDEYSDLNIEKMLSKITVDTSFLTPEEKENLLLRYFTIKFPNCDFAYPNGLKLLTSHVNFSPESVRSYFEDVDEFKAHLFLRHIGKPFKYLEKIFINLSIEKQSILLSILVSLRSDLKNIEYSYKNICNDYGRNSFISLQREVYNMDESIIKIEGNQISFFHPSMVDFFVEYLGNLNDIYRDVIIKNINFELLSLVRFNNRSSPEILKKYIYLELSDLDSLQLGFRRIISNQNISIADINAILIWLNSPNILISFKLQWGIQYRDFQNGVIFDLVHVNIDKFRGSSVGDLIFFFKQVTLHGYRLSNAYNIVTELLFCKKNDPDFWNLVFRIIPVTPHEILFDERYLGQTWFDEFYATLDAQIILLLKEQSSLRGLVDISWYPRYLRCKEQLKAIQAHHPLGYPRYENIINKFQTLKSREDYHQTYFNRLKGEGKERLPF
ncbi:hypothetical protein MUK70_15055 [Dyadobacter chenwenxiniae]|uniref:Novel STAND NTPase 3 domain-containing protein n=1 Tax=Dyadobacter chenwenxiniae TaxID=2906456 RepID=A0A9X1PHT7_9BACT|nr:hypothetical protein [Dyadobacter chenwenxiniae]MCF0060560.1 hypothetical protein [Dyadobacter chenwenxiniae]UON86291.1 hypothetical protein MUK70_15055 [Dyadobacter chenwenxiniae]